MFRIGDFSRLSNVSVRMLRHYDKLKLLVPDHIDVQSGYRYYSATQLKKINKIQKLKEMGFTLAMILEMLDSEANIEKIKSHFSIREAEVRDELKNLQKQRRLVESSLQLLREDVVNMDYHVTAKEIPKRKVISTRKVIPSYAQEGILWGILGGEFAAQHVKIAEPAYVTAIFHDLEYQESNVDIEVQTAVVGNYKDTPQVIFKETAEVQVASVMFNGSYDQMQAVTEAAAQWLEDNGYELDGPMFNIYYVTPALDPNPDNWVTEACYPFKLSHPAK
ncbi:Multidrug-efflux transporter 1 regulator [compost metagenome]